MARYGIATTLKHIQKGKKREATKKESTTNRKQRNRLGQGVKRFKTMNFVQFSIVTLCLCRCDVELARFKGSARCAVHNLEMCIDLKEEKKGK